VRLPSCKEKEQAFIAAQARLKGAEALDPSAAPVAIATERTQERARGEATPSHIEQRTKEPAKRK